MAQTEFSYPRFWNLVTPKATMEEMQTLLENEKIQVIRKFECKDRGGGFEFYWDNDLSNISFWPDSNGTCHLRQIKINQTFHLVETKKAQQYYLIAREWMENELGEPEVKENNYSEEVVHLFWFRKGFRIHLEYDYAYKVIDEMGGGSYWVMLKISDAAEEEEEY